MDKKKLNVDEQIKDMEEKGTKFEVCSKEDARRFLCNNTYYFKIKSYAKNYDISTTTGKYFNLDFAYLIELSKLDMYLRKIILDLSLDVEHFLKVRLLNDLCNNVEEDGYHIVELFLENYPNAKADIRNKANKYSFCSDLAEKHLDEFSETHQLAMWNVVELLSFGNFMELYKLYYQEYPSFNYTEYLNSIKFIRNAAAHNNCILSSIRKPNSVKKFRKTKKLATNMCESVELKSIENRDAMMRNPIIHDFVALLFVYNDILKLQPTKETRNRKMHEIRKEFCDEDGRFQMNKHYFDKNQNIINAYKFVSAIIRYIDRKNYNPRHINYLK